MTQQNKPLGTTSEILLKEVERPLWENGFSFLKGAVTKKLLDENAVKSWNNFAKSWDHLGIDRYMADHGRYRRRRYATFSISDPKTIIRKPHQPHYQSRDYNLVNGGIERWFEPVTHAVASHPVLIALLQLSWKIACNLTSPERRPPSWHVEIHQFRIEPSEDSAGLPTPEGLHRDGVDWVLVVLVHRHNIVSGKTTIHDLQKKEIGAFTLRHAFDTAFVDDNRVYHGVTAVHPKDPKQPAYRDVLVITLRHE